jgi:hypothetical protein
VGDAYLRFADEHPHAYRIMFEIDHPISDEHPDLLREVEAGTQLHHTPGRGHGEGRG